MKESDGKLKKKKRKNILSSKDQGQQGKPKVAESTKECSAQIMQADDSLLTSHLISSRKLEPKTKSQMTS
jgi:hypothetical protein